MKIFLAFLQGKPNHPIPAYGFWEFYIKNGITENNDNWIEEETVDWAEGLIYQTNSKEIQDWKDRTWSKTIAKIKKDKPHVFLSYLYPKQIDGNAIKEIQNLGIPCINFFCDHVREYRKLPKEFHIFDLNWVPEFDALELYKKNNLPHIHLPMPMWVDPKLRSIPTTHNNDITFIGSCDIQRTLFFNDYLELNNTEIKIYGKGWLENDIYINPFEKNTNNLTKINNQINFIQKEGFSAFIRKIQQRKLNILKSNRLINSLNGIISFEQYIYLTKNSLATIGINRYPSFNYPLEKPHTYSRLRDIEAPMLGALYITEKTSDINIFYENDEILTFSDTNELLDKVSFIKRNISLRSKLIQKSQVKSLSELTIPNSLNKIKSQLLPHNKH